MITEQYHKFTDTIYKHYIFTMDGGLINATNIARVREEVARQLAFLSLDTVQSIAESASEDTSKLGGIVYREASIHLKICGV